jgi:hypothetical protein
MLNPLDDEFDQSFQQKISNRNNLNQDIDENPLSNFNNKNNQPWI